MDEGRPVRCALTMEEASLLSDLLRATLTTGKDDEAITALMARLKTAEDNALDGASVRGPSTDAAEYEW